MVDYQIGTDIYDIAWWAREGEMQVSNLQHRVDAMASLEILDSPIVETARRRARVVA